MKIFAGNARIWSMALLLAALPAQARVTAEVDRTDIALGESLRLILRADEGEQPDDIDLSRLERDFEILQRSSATNARIINGSQSVTRTLELDLAPRRDGLLTVPALNYGGRQTTPIAIKVAPEPDIDIDDSLVQFDASVDKREVYVQAQILLTVTLQQAINLDNRAVSELDLTDTSIQPLEQTTFQRRIKGRLWQVTELRYALFPQTSGELVIPPINFSARELLPGRSLLGARLGRRIDIDTNSINVKVKPVPREFPGDVWLPARSLELTSSWSTPADALSVGDSSTRTIELTAEGLQGSQLPPITSLDSSERLSGIRFYPDKETINEREISSGVEGYRLQSEALVATEASRWTLPERVLPWWNTETDSLAYARLPAIDVVVTGSTVATVSGNQTEPPAGNAIALSSPTALWPWQLSTLLGWLSALILGWLLWRQNSAVRQPSKSVTAATEFGARDLVPLRLACSENNPEAARDALRRWGMHFMGTSTLPSLSTLATVTDPELAEELNKLDAVLYGSSSHNDWSGTALFSLVKNQKAPRATEDRDSLSLYPS